MNPNNKPNFGQTLYSLVARIPRRLESFLFFQDLKNMAKIRNAAKFLSDIRLKNLAKTRRKCIKICWENGFFCGKIIYTVQRICNNFPKFQKHLISSIHGSSINNSPETANFQSGLDSANVRRKMFVRVLTALKI